MQFPFTTSKTEFDIKYNERYIWVAEQLKTSEILVIKEILGKSQNFPEIQRSTQSKNVLKFMVFV